MGYGRSRGLGWLAVGYGPGGEKLAHASMRAALEERKSFLRSELARTEELLTETGQAEEAEK